MAIREIIQLDNPILRKKAVRVASFGSKFQTLVDDMIETLLAAPGVGLAAPQVAVSQRLIVVRLQDDEKAREEFGDQAGVLYVVANPKIIKAFRLLRFCFLLLLASSLTFCSKPRVLSKKLINIRS